MSESVKAAQTLVWRAGRGGADKPTQFATLPGRRNSPLLGQKDVSRRSVPLGYQGWTIYIRILIPFVRCRRYIGRRSTSPRGWLVRGSIVRTTAPRGRRYLYSSSGRRRFQNVFAADRGGVREKLQPTP